MVGFVGVNAKIRLLLLAVFPPPPGWALTSLGCRSFAREAQSFHRAASPTSHSRNRRHGALECCGRFAIERDHLRENSDVVVQTEKLMTCLPRTVLRSAKRS